jgi:adenine-specific DNA-methyltransferase
VRLPRLPVKPGELVALKREVGNRLWRVKTIHKNIATCDRAVTGYPGADEANQEFPVADLVVVRSFGDAIYPALVPVDRVERGGPDKPWHLLINADNFHALQLLLYSYEGKVDVIYIDPPYNTGARDWKYNNHYVDKTDSFRHSKWLSMMKKRLSLAKRMLKPEGVLVVAIDDYELHHLICLLDSIFGSECHLGTVAIRSKPQGRATSTGFSVTHEYAVFYGAGLGAKVTSLKKTGKQLSRYSQKDEKGFFAWENFRKTGQGCKREDRPKQFFPIYVDGMTLSVPKAEWHESSKSWKIISKPNGKEVWPITAGGEERVWKWSFKRAGRDISDLRVVRVDDGIEVQKKLRMKADANLPFTLWEGPEMSASEQGTKDIVATLGDKDAFSFPKSKYNVSKCLLSAGAHAEALVMDFFAGSGTTYQAVAMLNADDGGERRCILVTNNEVKESVATELATKDIFLGDSEFEARGVCEAVTWPRCRAVTTGERADGTPLEGVQLDGREFSEGFEENLECFRLDFLNPDEVARGDAFQAILPILWMMAGCRGKREESKGSQAWLFPKHAPFAVLIKEKEFRAFREALGERKDIEWIYLVTDSEENFGLMRRALGRKFHCVQLYKNYLENFRINTPEMLGEGGVA